MNQMNNFDFGKLYRAAFAERDPQKKLVLLSQVHSVVKPWEDETPALVRFDPVPVPPFQAKAIA